MQPGACGDDGESFSLVALCPAFAVGMGDSERPVMVHVTVCRRHLVAARARLRQSVIPGDSIDTYRTATLMQHWSQVTSAMGDTPILELAAAG
jgi:hypothetical protein